MRVARRTLLLKAMGGTSRAQADRSSQPLCQARAAAQRASAARGGEAPAATHDSPALFGEQCACTFLDDDCVGEARSI